MSELNDHELLAEFARSGSEPAFASVVARHVNLVYSAALRFSGNEHHAQEITQAVFIILARKAGQLSPRVVLSGWLYQTARLTAANFVKAEVRRQQREQEAYMQSTLDETGAAAWEQLAPLLDEAMGHLDTTDRNAVVLRFFENKTAAEVAAALKLSEGAAHKRVYRALEKLRKIFGRRGVTLSAAIIAGVVSANSVQAAPASLAAAATAAATTGASIFTTLTTLVKTTMKTMTWLKLKFPVGVGLTALLAGGVAMVAVSQITGGDHKTPQSIAKQALAAYAALSSYSDSGTATAEGGGANTQTTFNIRLQRPNFYRVDWAQTGGNYASKGVIWSQGNGNFMLSGPADQFDNARPQTVSSMQQTFASAMGVSSSSASIPAEFYKQNFGAVLAVPASDRTPSERGPDETVGGVDCYVLTYKIDASKFTGEAKTQAGKGGNLGITTTTLWIGKQDHLIHQSRTVSEGMSLTLPPTTDSQIKSILAAQNKAVTPEAITDMRAQMETMMKNAQGAKFIFTQTHDNIVLNQKFTPADFVR